MKMADLKTHLKIKQEYERVFKNLQDSSQLDISQLHNSVEVSDYIDDQLSSCDNEIQTRLRHEFFQNGPLEKLIRDPHVTEIILNGPRKIWYEKNGVIHDFPDEFLSPVTYRNFILRLCQESRIQVHLDQPCTDGQWRDFRVHLIQPPLVKKDFHLCLRRHPESPWTLPQLVQSGWCAEETTALLRQITRKNSVLMAFCCHL